MSDANALDALVQALKRLPGVGIKSAQRMAFYLLQHDRAGAQTLARALEEAATQVHHCERCHTFTEHPVCSTCLDPQRDLKDRDVEFNNALGTVYTKRFNQDREKLELFDKAVEAYKHVLELDPRNYGANYNLATLYYNRGVYNIQRISAENDIPSIQGIQAVSREFFMQALPYMLEAFEMNPTRRETLLGLEGIYYSLQDDKQSDHYRQLYEALENEPQPEK